MLSSSDKAVGVRKRDRYIAYACNRCRAAKVRCNGKLPCSYCVARDPASCRYRNPRAIDETSQQEHALQQVQPKHAEGSGNFPIQAPRDRGIDSTGYDSLRVLLQHQNHKLDAILERVSNIETGQKVQQDGNKGSPGNMQLECEEPLPVIQSSTSAFFCIHIIDANLKGLEKPAETTQPQKDRKASSPSSFSILHNQIVDEIAADIGEWNDEESGMRPSNLSAALQSVSIYPLDNFEVAEIIRLVQKYHDIVGIMYPVADVTSMLDLIENAETIDNGNEVYSRGGSLCLRRGDETILQMMVAIALAAENENGCHLIQSLHDNVLPDAQHMVWSTKTDLQGLVLLALVSLFYYHTHKWRLAWRFLGNVARIILELGLNRRLVLDKSFPHMKARTQALNVIWAVFVLEQQLRNALGLSMTAQDLALDPTFPKPVNAPYLEAMIQYIRIGSHASGAIVYDRRPSEITPENLQEIYTYFQYRLGEWCKSIDREFKFKSQHERAEEWNRRLNATLRLRAHVLQIGIARFILFGEGFQAMPSTEIWATCIDSAAATAYILAAVDAEPPQFQSTTSESNYFLISALGILLLAISQSMVLSPEERPLSPAAFLKAQESATLCLNLLRSRSNASRPSKHLWKRVRSLASRLNLLDDLAPSSLSEAEENLKAEQLQTGNTIDSDLLPLTGAPVSTRFDSNIEFGSPPINGITDISTPSRNTFLPFSMALDSTYMFTQLLADFEQDSN